MRRIESSTLHSRGPHHGRDVCAYCSLAIGASNVDGLPCLGGVLKELRGPAYAQPYHPLEGRVRCLENRQ